MKIESLKPNPILVDIEKPRVVRVNDWITRHLFIVFGLPVLAFFAYCVIALVLG